MSIWNREPDPEYVAHWQWMLVDELERAASNGWFDTEPFVRNRARQILQTARRSAEMPQQWADLLAREIIKVVTELLTVQRSATDLTYQVAQSERYNAYLKAKLTDCSTSSSSQRVAELTQKLDEQYQYVDILLKRVHDLEAALDGERHKKEHLRQENADMQRIIAEQQRQLNDLLAPDA